MHPKNIKPNNHIQYDQQTTQTAARFHVLRSAATRMLLLFLLAGIITLGGCQSSSADRPLIGITSVYKVNQDNDLYSKTTAGFAYVRAVSQCGGVPVILPTIDDEENICQYIDRLDGLVLIGGADIPPEAYGQTPHKTVAVMTDQRYQFENRLIPAWLKSGKPTLGICLGMQFTNVVSGGTMIQDIPTFVHDNLTHRGNQAYHEVTIEPDSTLYSILKSDRASVLSNHHQAVDKLGKNLRVTARAGDGVIEALERTDGPFGLFVQWHPELMDDIEHRNAIYSALIEACREK